MALYPDYVELDDLKRHLRIPGVYDGTLNQEEDLHDDAELRLAITAASRMVDHATNRQFGQSTNTDQLIYTPTWNSQYRTYGFEIDDLMTVSGLAIRSYSTDTELFDTTVSDYMFLPRNAPTKGQPWTSVILDRGSDWTAGLGDWYPGSASDVDSIEIEAKFGWTEVPQAIKQATLIQASRFFKRRDAPFGIAGSVETGSEMRLLNKLDPDVAMLVSPYKRWYGAG